MSCSGRIVRFRGRFSFLSNFSSSFITHGGKTFATAEHLFQWLKTNDAEWKERIRLAPTPQKAKALGRKAPIRPDWKSRRDEAMTHVVEQKFKQNPALRQQLLATGDQVLVEGNNWGDTYWGVSLKTGEGRNTLGRILMMLRSNARKECSIEVL